jgi:hypothetical protein
MHLDVFQHRTRLLCHRLVIERIEVKNLRGVAAPTHPHMTGRACTPTQALAVMSAARPPAPLGSLPLKARMQAAETGLTFDWVMAYSGSVGMAAPKFLQAEYDESQGLSLPG